MSQEVFAIFAYGILMRVKKIAQVMRRVEPDKYGAVDDDGFLIAEYLPEFTQQHLATSLQIRDSPLRNGRVLLAIDECYYNHPGINNFLYAKKFQRVGLTEQHEEAARQVDSLFGNEKPWRWLFLMEKE